MFTAFKTTRYKPTSDTLVKAGNLPSSVITVWTVWDIKTR